MRNIVLITIDSLRADHCGFMGYERDTTPTLDAMASGGMAFENAISPGPSTYESMPAIFTGSFPHSDTNGGGNAQEVISTHLSRCRTIPERLSELGYSTAGFSPNPFTSRYFGFDVGFDEYHDFLDDDDPLAPRFRPKIISRWVHGDFVTGLRFGINMIGSGDLSTSWESYYDSVRQWVQSTSEPYFLWVFLLEPHWPYRPPRRHREHSLFELYRRNWRRAPASRIDPNPTDRKILIDLYDGAIKHTDEFLGQVRYDLPGDPALVVHADHGEAFGEHGQFGHGPLLYEENIRVPLIVSNVDNSRRISCPFSLRCMPELLDSIAMEDTDWQEYTQSLVTARGGDGRIALRSHNWKFIAGNEDELYDLASDSDESKNLATERTAVANCCKNLVSHCREDWNEKRLVTAETENLAEDTLL